MAIASKPWDARPAVKHSWFRPGLLWFAFLLPAFFCFGGALKRLVSRAIGGISDPGYFQHATGVAQVPPQPDAQDIAWLRPYLDRYPNPAWSAMLARLPSRGDLYFGGLPPP